MEDFRLFLMEASSELLLEALWELLRKLLKSSWWNSYRGTPMELLKVAPYELQLRAL